MDANPERARTIAEQAISSATAAMDNPADLINVALEELIRAHCELPAHSTLDRLAGRIRAEPLPEEAWRQQRREISGEIVASLG